MNAKLREIYHRFDGKLVGREILKLSVCRVLSKMPENIVDYVSKNCWFMGSLEDAWAFTFTGNDLKNKHLIFLSDELFKQEQQQIFYTIAHEVGHVILEHRNSTLERQSPQEIKQQEREAHEFALKYS